MARARILLPLLAAIVVAVAAGGLSAGTEDQLIGSAHKLPGCDNLPQRMAGYYQPVEVKVTPAAKAYKLPLDLSKLTNAGFSKSAVYPFSHKKKDALMNAVNALLEANGFAVFAGPQYDDVAGFYNTVKTRGLPIFITSDSLLHLYHIQFDETLKGIEEREFFDDATLISKAIQAEALALHKATDGDLKQAALLLVGYATVPVVVLSQSNLGAEAATALKELESWPDQPNWRQRGEFLQKYKEVIDAVVSQQGITRHPVSLPVGELKASLEKYVKAHPPDADPGELIPKIVDKEVRAELELIAAHKDFAPSPLFTYKEDYSQYVPRGHYTRSEKLKQYFKALMWYGRMTFIIRGADKAAGIDGVISKEEARIQTLAAAMLAGMMEKKLPDRSTSLTAGGRTLAATWDRLYSVTAYYVGLADDLTPYEYRLAMRGSMIGQEIRASSLANDKKFFELRKALAQMRKPEIYSGLGDLEGPPAAIADERTLAKALAMTQGLRLMGQRYIPDSYMMGRMVYPTVGVYNGPADKPFTYVMSDGGPIRGFPRGLDVMCVLGSGRARHWLKELGDDQYVRYDETLAQLQKQFGEVSQADWNRNMYWSWLYSLKALLKEYPSGYPTFMQTSAWRDKQLSAALASWSQLRHDTILYAKQSYTMRATAMPARPKMVEGYVEPVPEFYARLLALTRMTLRGLDDFKALDDKSRARLVALESIVARLLKISQQELANEKLSEDDYAFIRSFGSQLKSAVAGVDSDGLETTIVADVHTDGNTRQVLEEGTGYLHTMVVVYPMPDGGLVAGVGPVLSHYEFKHPMSDRLTDEAWKKMLRTAPPKLPEWTRTFTAEAANQE